MKSLMNSFHHSARVRLWEYGGEPERSGPGLRGAYHQCLDWEEIPTNKYQISTEHGRCTI